MNFTITKREYGVLLAALYNGHENIITLSQAHEKHHLAEGEDVTTVESRKFAKEAASYKRLRAKIAKQGGRQK